MDSKDTFVIADIQAPGDGAFENKQNRLVAVTLTDKEIEAELVKLGDAARTIVCVSLSTVREIMQAGHGTLHFREALALLLMNHESAELWARSF